jgi:hypothetical protein
MRPASIEEVEHTLKEMALGKAPKPDGFTTDFFHKCWKILGKYIWEVVEESRASKSMLKALNATHIALIQKKGGQHNG